MAKFTDLNESDRVQYIKDEFVKILEDLSSNPTKVRSYVSAPTKPSILVSEPKKKAGNKKENKEVQNVVSDAAEVVKTEGPESEKLESDSKEKEDASKLFDEEVKQYEENLKKIEAIVSSIKKKEGCICNTCININITSMPIQAELEPLIDAARKAAEQATY